MGRTTVAFLKEKKWICIFKLRRPYNTKETHTNLHVVLGVSIYKVKSTEKII